MSAVAAIDLGTNSCRLLVLAADGRTVLRTADITRLGGGLGRTGRLSPEGVTATLEVLGRYRGALDEHDVHEYRVVATAAARRAADAAGFLTAAADVIGRPVDVLSGDEEARLSFAGATAHLAPDQGPFLVADIGGGSTELAGGTDAATTVTSLDLGCVSLTEAELHHDRPRPEELTNAIGFATDAMAEAWRHQPALRDATTLVGVGGTFTTLAAVELGLATYDRTRVHGLVLVRAVVEDVFRTLATESLEDRVHNPGLQRGRADVIVGGLCIVVALLRNLPADEVHIADADLLDAVARSLLA